MKPSVTIDSKNPLTRKVLDAQVEQLGRECTDPKCAGHHRLLLTCPDCGSRNFTGGYDAGNLVLFCSICDERLAVVAVKEK